MRRREALDYVWILVQMEDLQPVDMRMGVFMFLIMIREEWYIVYLVSFTFQLIQDGTRASILTNSGLIQPIRTISFSPLSTYLAAAGDSTAIALYSVTHGEQVANMTGHTAWIFSIDWSFTGEYLVSGAWDGKVKVWSVEGRNCVATHSETDKALWAVKWLPKVQGRSEAFVTAGANGSLSFYREATGG